MYYDSTPLTLGEKDVKETEIRSRDIDRQDFPHYFLKEISESPDSVEKTLLNRWKVSEEATDAATIVLDETTFPQKIKSALSDGRIRRIFFIGQGTAGVAALACANILDTYLNDPSVYVIAMKASELSGFKLGGLSRNLTETRAGRGRHVRRVHRQEPRSGGPVPCRPDPAVGLFRHRSGSSDEVVLRRYPARL